MASRRACGQWLCAQTTRSVATGYAGGTPGPVAADGANGDELRPCAGLCATMQGPIEASGGCRFDPGANRQVGPHDAGRGARAAHRGPQPQPAWRGGLDGRGRKLRPARCAGAPSPCHAGRERFRGRRQPGEGMFGSPPPPLRVPGADLFALIGVGTRARRGCQQLLRWYTFRRENRYTFR